MTENTDVTTRISGAISTAEGGILRASSESPMHAKGGVQVTEYGAALGPLEVIAYPGSTALVGGLDYMEAPGFVDSLFRDGEGGGLFGLLPLLAAPEAAARIGTEQTKDVEPGDENRVSRRDLMRAGAATVGVVGGAATVAAAASPVVRARFAVLENPAGIRLRVRDRVPDVLPTDRQYHVYLDGRDYGDFQAASLDSYGDVLPEATGTVTVGPSGSAGGLLTRLLGSRSHEFSGLAMGKPLSEADPGERIPITDNDILVDTIQQAGSSNTICKINGESIPHVHEDSKSNVGNYSVMDGKIVYEVGTHPPGGETASLTVYASRTDEALDDVSRRTP